MGYGTRAVMIVAVLAAAACRGPEAKKQPLGAGPMTGDPAAEAANPHRALSPEAKAALDSGNALFRAKNFPLALAQYRLAAKLAPEHAAPFFGIYMVAKKLNDQKLADSAMVQVNAHADNAAPMFNDSLMKKAHTDAKAAPPPPKS